MSKTDNWKYQYCDTINNGESVQCEVCGRKKPDESVLAETEESMFTLDMFPDIPLIPINSFRFEPPVPEPVKLSNGQCWVVAVYGLLFYIFGLLLIIPGTPVTHAVLFILPDYGFYALVQTCIYMLVLPSILTYVVYLSMILSCEIPYKRHYKRKSEQFKKNVQLIKNTADFIEKKDMLNYRSGCRYRIAKRGKLGLAWISDGDVKLFLPPEYSQITALDGTVGLLKIVKDGRVGIYEYSILINTDSILINTEYDDIALCEEDKRYLFLKNNGLYGLYSLSMNKIVVPVIYDTVCLYKEEIIKALVNSQCYYFDKYGNVLH